MNPLVIYCITSAAVNAITSFALGLYVIVTNHRSLASRTFFGFSMSVGFWSFCYTFWQMSTQASQALFWLRCLMMGAIFIPTFFIHFVITLLDLNSAKRRLIQCSYLLSIVLIFSNFSTLFISGVTPRDGFRFWAIPGLFFHPFLLHFASAVVYAHYLLFQELKVASGSRRNQIKYVFLGTLLGFAGGTTNFPLWYNIPIPPIGNALVTFYVAMTAYSIARFRLLDINLVLSRLAVFTIVYAPLLVLPILLGELYQSALSSLVGENWWILPTLFEAVVATIGLLVYRFVRQKAEDRLLSEQRRYQTTLRQASEGMTRIRQLPRLLKLTAGILSRAVGLTYVSIYLQDGETKRYVQQVAKGKDGPLRGTILELGDQLINYLLVHKNAIVLEELHMQRQQTTDAGLRDVQMTLRRLGAAVVIPSFVHDYLLGFVVMGTKRSGRMYTDDDIKVLMTLANQSALAVENARFYEAEKDRQAEMFHTAQLASLGTMAGSMSHQINNRFHMEGIVAGVQRTVLKELDLTGVPEPVKESIQKTIVALKKIEEDAIRGGDIAKTLLDFSKPGKMDRIAFPEVIKLATDLAQYRVKFEEIDFEPVLSNPLPPLNANKNQLTESLFNLMANAYDAMKRKEEIIKDGLLTLLPGQTYRGRLAISVTTVNKNGATWLQAVVHDNGIGIKPEEVSRLFVPFFTTKGAEKGTGLGLYVIKKIVENHGGKLEVTSAYGEGTTFTIYLPTAGGTT